MRAIAVSEYGATPALTYLPRPEPGPGELLVKLIAAGLNPYDWRAADGMLKDTADATFPLVLGADGAGVVEDAGEGVTRLRHGEQVYGFFSDLERGRGSYAEYAVVPVDGPVARMPASMIYTRAAAVPTACAAALDVVERAGLGEGRTVLIAGATGGVGRAAVQLAARAGAEVVATARADADAAVRRLGAAHTVDHTAGDLGAQVLAACPAGLDALIVTAGDTARTTALARLLRPGGTCVSTVWTVDPDAMAEHGLHGVNVDGAPTAGTLERLADLIDAGELSVHIEREAPLEAAPDALARNRAGGARGKTVLRIL
ncbi:NADP-dependent oxidoreductase [Actinomadura sp. WMMB 499]|uniref:NADP-dependent oxidoreductase n=1 Tax=Actinomadura sp. WMMB 499 TaxID=1219491 RepID=UPI0012454754|nr:NADP-dependent oxidoreductase [Actinomadura sp. WMMB 499]QFG24743.1 NADP-dependent oxidoreductase [Actinomadura sp. WMMB 499]